MPDNHDFAQRRLTGYQPTAAPEERPEPPTETSGVQPPAPPVEEAPPEPSATDVEPIFRNRPVSATRHNPTIFAKLTDPHQPINWQPVVDTLAAWLNSKTFTFALIVLFLVICFGSNRVAGWLESIGAEALIRIFNGGVH